MCVCVRAVCLQGGNHRLEIQPDLSGSTLVHMSDFSDDQDDNGAPDIVVENADDDYQHKMKSLQAEMESIRAKVGQDGGWD